MALTAIETSYNGYRFRSRLEARYAIFFDALGIDYIYEPEGFWITETTKYLPDFWLNIGGNGMYIEIKPTLEKAQETKDKWLSFALSQNINFVLCVGIPGNSCTYQVHLWPKDALPIIRDLMPEFGTSADKRNKFRNSEYDSDHLLVIQKSQDGLFYSIRQGVLMGPYQHGVSRLAPKAKVMSDLQAAYKAARSARFEYGERS